MSASSMDIERALTVWLSDGATVMPEGVTDAVAERIAGTRQRPLRLPWTSLPRYQTARLQRLAALAAVLVVAAAAGFGLFGGSILGPAGPTHYPDTTAVPSPSSQIPTHAPTPGNDASPRAPGELSPGGHSWTHWLPGVSFTVPQGWSASDSAEHFTLSSTSGTTVT